MPSCVSRASISLLLLLVLVCVANGQDLPDPERARVVSMFDNRGSFTGPGCRLRVEYIRDEPTKTYAWITVSRRVFQTARIGDIWLYDDRGWRPEPK